MRAFNRVNQAADLALETQNVFGAASVPEFASSRLHRIDYTKQLDHRERDIS
jgi:hypothetical protein